MMHMQTSKIRPALDEVTVPGAIEQATDHESSPKTLPQPPEPLLVPGLLNPSSPLGCLKLGSGRYKVAAPDDDLVNRSFDPVALGNELPLLNATLDE